MNPSLLAAIAYGVLAIAGGILGYVQARSTASLISGSVSGALLLLSGWLQAQGSRAGWWLAVAVTAALIAVFGVRLAKTRKLMPAGLMLGAGAIALVTLLTQAAA